MIYVENSYAKTPRKATKIYIGRGSPVGNPFPMRNRSREERDRVCDLYAEWFSMAVSAKTKQGDSIREYLELIAASAKDGDVELMCFCAPKRCHGETIKRYLEENYDCR